MSGEALPLRTGSDLTLETVAAIASAVPTLGGPISNVLSGYLTGKKLERVRDFIVKLKEDVGKLGDRLIQDYVATEEFESLLDETLRRVAVEVREDKRELYRKYLLGLAQSPGDSYDEQRSVLRAFDEIQGDHVRVLKALTAAPEGTGSSALPGTAEDTLLRRMPGMSPEVLMRRVGELGELRLGSVNLRLMVPQTQAEDLRGCVSRRGRMLVTYITNGDA